MYNYSLLIIKIFDWYSRFVNSILLTGRFFPGISRSRSYSRSPRRRHSRSRSRSYSSKERRKRRRSYSSDYSSRSRSRSPSHPRTRERDSRSPSIRRRRGSPSHLEKRRITRYGTRQHRPIILVHSCWTRPGSLTLYIWYLLCLCSRCLLHFEEVREINSGCCLDSQPLENNPRGHPKVFVISENGILKHILEFFSPNYDKINNYNE